MTSCLDGTVLDLASNLRGEVAHRDLVVSEVGMMPRVRLDADAPGLLCHAEHEGPAVLRIQVGIGQHEQALVVAEFDVLFKIIENLPRMELFDPCVWPDTRLNNFLFLESS